MQDTGNIHRHAPGVMIIDMADRILLMLYSHIRRNSRRLTHLIVTLLPLMALLVGSCKTSQLPWAYSGNAAPEQVRMALFPDRANFHDAHYYPASGYIARAQTFVVSQPQLLMMLVRQEIGYLFGKPTLHRQDADAEVWQYKTGSCVVDFYFYDENNSRDQSKLSYIDVRLKDEMIPGSAPRFTAVSTRERSECLHDVVAQGFSGIHVKT